MRFAAIVFGLAAFLCAFAEKPLVLIAQDRATDFTDRDPNIDVMRALGESFAKTGKVSVSIWSKGDPLVQAALSSGEWNKWTDKPKLEDCFALAKVIGADYILFCKATRATGEEKAKPNAKPTERIKVTTSGGLVRAAAVLYSKRKEQLWKDETSISILVGQELDEQSTALSISNSWLLKLSSGPMKTVFGAPEISPPDVGPPTVPNHQSETIDKKPLESGLAALTENRLAAAITYLRDAVDADPMNPEPRLKLIEALRRNGNPFLAADEAARAAELLPDNQDLLVEGAQAWLDGGQLDKAYAWGTQVIQKKPNDPAANAVMADLYLRKLDFEKAIAFYDTAVKNGDSAELRYKRSVALALKGDFDASVADLQTANQMGLSQDPAKIAARYTQTVSVIDAVYYSLSSLARTLLGEAKTSPNDKSVGNRLAQLQSRCTAFLNYLDQLKPPAKYTESHAGRSLALNLLIESVQNIQKFLLDRSSDTEQDANLLHLESVREYVDASEKFKIELSKSK